MWLLWMAENRHVLHWLSRSAAVTTEAKCGMHTKDSSGTYGKEGKGLGLHGASFRWWRRGEQGPFHALPSCGSFQFDEQGEDGVPAVA
jgi:hypothetical protein